MTKTALSVLALLAAASAAAAQDIAYAEANFGLKMTTTSFAATTHPIDFAERATVQSSYDVPTALAFDVGGGVKITRNVAVGVGVSRFMKGGNVAVDAQVPHPFFFTRLRPVSGTAGNLSRDETAVHVRLLWTAPMAAGWVVSIGGGPSLFKVGQDLVDDITINQTYPYDTATFASVVSTRHTGKAAGFNVLADVTRRLTPHVGVGVAAGFDRAKVDITASDTTTMTVDAGGAHVAGGVRFRF